MIFYIMVNIDLLFNLQYWFSFISDGATSVYIFYLIMKNIMIYRSYGAMFWLLVLLELAVVIDLIGSALEFKVNLVV